MMSESDSLALIVKLTGVSEASIKISDDGFLSRGYIVDNGRIIFKFPREKSTTYENEITILNYINGLNVATNLQKVGWISGDNSYLGLYGVEGESLENLSLTTVQKQDIGKQLASFLEELHRAQPKVKNKLTLAHEISAWQSRYLSVKNYLQTVLSSKEHLLLEQIMMDYMPKTLTSFGENLVFSHGDLGDGNIYVDKNGRVGIIDFNSSGYFDEAADFMDISDNELRNIMLDEYHANDKLRDKVELRKEVRPVIVIKQYLERGDLTTVASNIEQIRHYLLSKY